MNPGQLVLSWVANGYLLAKRTIPRWMLVAFAAMTFSGWIATLAGWLVTEIGRQPYLVYGVMTGQLELNAPWHNR